MKRLIYLLLLTPFLLTAQGNVLNSGQELSPSARAEIKTRNRAFTAGGGTLELQKPADYIRDISRDLNYDITSDASLIMTPNTIGEGRLFNCKPDLFKNLLKQSQDYSTSNWSKNTLTITNNTNTNAFGENRSQYLVESSATDQVTLLQQIPLTSGSYVASIYIKKADVDWIQITAPIAVSGTIWFNVNLSTGTIGNSGGGVFTKSVTSLGSGWFKIEVSFNNSFNGTSSFVLISGTGNTDVVTRLPTYTAIAGTKLFDLCGFQIERGIASTGYERTSDGITDFQVTRATTATVIQKDGSIGSACYNLNQQAEDLGNAIWLKTRSTVSTNQIANPVNGLVDADKLIEDTTSTSTHYITQGGLVSLINTTYTASIYAKAGERTKFIANLSLNAGTNAVSATIDLSAGTTNQPTFSSVASVGNGWFRISITRTTNATDTDLIFRLILLDASGNSSYTGDGVSGLYLWGSQLVLGSQPKDYLKTTNRLAVPSIDYGLGSSLPALLVEPQRTNIIFPSATATSQSRTVTAQPYTLSFYGTGTVDLSGVHTATIIGTGTVLKTYTFTPTAGSLTFTITGTVTDWQVEAGSNYTSRIITTSAAATRNDYTSFVDLYNSTLLDQNNFTVYIEGYTDSRNATTPWFGFSDSSTISTNNSLYLYNGNGLGYYSGGVQTLPGMTTNLDKTYFKTAIVKNGTSLKVYRDGVLQLSTTLAAFDYRYLVLTGGLARNFIQKIVLWKRSISDSDLITATTP